MARGKFNFRVFTSMMLFWTFMCLIVSGTVLYMAPPGRIANWTRWQLLVLTKEQWQAVHILAALAFLVGGLFHLLKFNWKAFIAYLKRKTESRLQFRRELLYSLLLFLGVMAGTIAEQPPFSAVMAGAESLRNSWEEPATSPPMAHMEELTLRQLEENLQLEPGQIQDLLRAQGIAGAAMEETLKDVAERYDRSPQEVYAQLQQHAGGGPDNGAVHPTGGGQGFKTLAQFCGELPLATETALERLRARGIEAGEQERLRDIADRHKIKPYELIEILRGESNP